MPTPAGPARHRLSLRSSHSSEARNSNVARQRARFEVEGVERLGGGEPGGFQAGALVGCLAGGDLFADEGGEQFVRRPALGLGGLQQLGRELAHSAQPQSSEPGLELGIKRLGHAVRSDSPPAIGPRPSATPRA